MAYKKKTYEYKIEVWINLIKKYPGLRGWQSANKGILMFTDEKREKLFYQYKDFKKSRDVRCYGEIDRFEKDRKEVNYNYFIDEEELTRYYNSLERLNIEDIINSI